MFNGRRQPSCGGTSRMTRECQVRFCERLGVKFPGPTRRVSRGSPVQTAMRNCTRDEGRSFEVGNQVLISSHRKLPRRSHACNPLHSMTRSARFSISAGTVTPNSRAVLRLITSWCFEKTSIAVSAGFAPLRILSTYTGTRGYVDV
jgi:hypothetical protein